MYVGAGSMQVTFRAKTKIECINYFMLEYQGGEYALKEFSVAFGMRQFKLERLLRNVRYK